MAKKSEYNEREAKRASKVLRNADPIKTIAKIESFADSNDFFNQVARECGFATCDPRKGSGYIAITGRMNYDAKYNFPSS